MCLNITKLLMISANYHNITRLLLLTIIVSSKNYTISIIGKDNIMVNRQNRLIAHPYFIRTIVNDNFLVHSPTRGIIFLIWFSQTVLVAYSLFRLLIIYQELTMMLSLFCQLLHPLMYSMIRFYIIILKLILMCF